jgi:hypothetical protein
VEQGGTGGEDEEGIGTGGTVSGRQMAGRRSDERRPLVGPG